MPRGRRPDPAHVQAAKGNPRKRGRKQLDAMRRAENGETSQTPAERLTASQASEPLTGDPIATLLTPATTATETIAPAEHREAVSTAPADLDEDARLIWDEIAPELIRLKFLRLTDVPAFKRYCMRLAQFWKNATALKAMDTVYQTETPHGKMYRSHPLFMQQLLIEKRLVDFEDRFGLNPIARQRIVLNAASRAPMLPGLDRPTRSQGKDGSADAGPGAETAPAATPQARAIGFLNPQRLN